MRVTLRDIATLMQQDASGARQALLAYLDDHPERADAWYMLSFVAETDAEKRAALEHALQLDPDNAKFRARWDKLRSASRGAAPASRWLLVLGALVLVGVLGALGFLLLSGGDDSSETPVGDLPTRVALATETTTPSPSPTPTASPTETSSTTPSVTVVPTQPAPDATATPEPPVSVVIRRPPTQENAETSETPVEGLLPTAVSPAALLTAALIPVATQAALIPTLEPGVTAIPVETIAAQITAMPTITDMPPELSATPNPNIPTPEGAILYRSEYRIDVGRLRILQASFPASAAIAELTGRTPPNPPANQSWVLVELLVICDPGATCLFPMTTFEILGGSQTVYTLASAVTVDPVFGRESAVGQSWGYLVFAVNNSEQALWLVMRQPDGNQYRFALQ